MKKMFTLTRLERCFILVGLVLTVLYTRDQHTLTLAGWAALWLIVTIVLWILWALLTTLRAKRH